MSTGQTSTDTAVSATHNTRLGFTPEQQKLAEEVREFADKVIAPVSYDYDRERRIPYELSESGWTDSDIPDDAQ